MVAKTRKDGPRKLAIFLHFAGDSTMRRFIYFGGLFIVEVVAAALFILPVFEV
jgi:hypothetical protein